MLRHFLLIVQRRMGSIILYGAMVPSDVTSLRDREHLRFLQRFSISCHFLAFETEYDPEYLTIIYTVGRRFERRATMNGIAKYN